MTEEKVQHDLNPFCQDVSENEAIGHPCIGHQYLVFQFSPSQANGVRVVIYTNHDDSVSIAIQNQALIINHGFQDF